MFFEGSTRSTRSSISRSPTTPSSSSAAAFVSGRAATSASSSASGASGATKVGAMSQPSPRISRTDASYARAHRAAWNPHGTDAIDEHSAVATEVGSTRIEFGPQNAVCVKWTTRRSGRAFASIPGTSASW